MKSLVFLIASLMIVGCSSFRQDESPPIKVELLEKYPIPIIPDQIFRPNMRFYTKMLIDTSGNVADAVLLYSSGDESFDMQMTNSLKKWRFAPIIYNNRPIKLWVRQDLVIVIADELYVPLSMILCPTAEEAAMVYDSLQLGKQFGELAFKHSVDISRTKKGILGRVNIYLFSEDIQASVKDLRVNSFTKPIAYGRNYVIFKRNEF